MNEATRTAEKERAARKAERYRMIAALYRASSLPAEAAEAAERTADRWEAEAAA